MKKYLDKTRAALLKIKSKFLSAHAKFLQTKIGKITSVVTSRLGKFFQTRTGKMFLMLASFASFMLFVSWQFSAMLIAMLYVHELGHVWAMKRCGMKPNGIYFIPFVGAAVPTDSNFPSHRAGIFVAIMGPIWGFAFAILLGGIYFFTKSPLYAVMAGVAAFFNWFNLLPVYPLDGGRVAKSVFSSIHWSAEVIFLVLSGIGLVASGIVSVYHRFFLLGLFFIVFGIIVLILSLFWEKENLPPLTLTGIIISAICYVVALAVMLAFAVWIMDLPNTIEGVGIVRTY